MRFSLRPAAPMALVATAFAASAAISMSVAAERDRLDTLRVAAARDGRDIRNLQAELRTRARLPELQRWNDEVLGMAPPAAGQYLADPVQLASFARPPADAAAPAGPPIVYAEAMPAPSTPTTPLHVAYDVPAPAPTAPLRVAYATSAAPAVAGLAGVIEDAAARKSAALAAPLR